MESTVLLPVIVQGGAGISSSRCLDQPTLVLCDALIAKLKAVPVNDANDLYLRDRELAKNYSHLHELLKVAQGEHKDAVAKFLIESYGDLYNYPAARVFSDIAYRLKDDRDFTARLLVRNFPQVIESAKTTLDSVGQVEIGHFTRVDFLIFLHTLASTALNRAEELGDISGERAESLREQVSSILVDGVIQRIIPLWISSYRQITENRFDIFSEHAFHNPMSVEATRLRVDYLTAGISTLLAEWSGDRNKLGNLYFDQIAQQANTRGFSNTLGYMALVNLPLLAPDPERKDFIVHSMRVGLLDDAEDVLLGETSDRPTQIARVLGLSLIPDHLYFSHEANKRYDPELCLDLARGINEAPVDLDRYKDILTPSQIFLIELLVIAQGADFSKEIKWLAPYDSTTRNRVVTRAQDALKRLMLDLYTCHPKELLADKRFTAETRLVTPKFWGTPSIGAGEQAREVQHRDSMRAFFEIADVILESRTKRQPKVVNVYYLSTQITDVVDTLRLRGSFYRYDEPDREIPAVKFLRERYRKKDTQQVDVNNPNLFDELKAAIAQFADDQSLQALQDTQPVSKEESLKLADRYIDLVQRVCILEFAIRDILNGTVNDAGTFGPARRNLMSALEVCGFLERDPKLSEILQSKDLEELLENLELYRDQLEAQMSEAAAHLGF